MRSYSAQTLNGALLLEGVDGGEGAPGRFGVLLPAAVGVGAVFEPPDC